MITDSVALPTSAADAVVDALAATATFFGVRFAQHPADLEHPDRLPGLLGHQHDQ
jgi:divalent metal cation (Fe/Co/Zn/Cd) transporter